MAVTQNQPPGTPRARIPGPRQPPTPYPRIPAGLWKRCLGICPAPWTPTAVVTYATGGRHAAADPDPARRLPRARPLRAPGVRTARPRPGHACGPRPLPGRRRPGRARRLGDGVPAHPPFAVDVRGHRTRRGGREARRADVPGPPAHPDPRTTGRSGARRDARVRLRGPGERGPRLRRGRVPAGRRPAHAPGDRDPARGAHPVRTRPVGRGHRRGPAGAALPARRRPDGRFRLTARPPAPASAPPCCTHRGTPRTGSRCGRWPGSPAPDSTERASPRAGCRGPPADRTTSSPRFRWAACSSSRS